MTGTCCATPGTPSTCTAWPVIEWAKRGPSTPSAGTSPCSATTGSPSPTASRPLDLHRELGDGTGQADAWDSVGHAHHHLGNYREATACYRRALDLFRDLGDRYFVADTLSHLARTQWAAGDPDAARASWQRALDILDRLGHAAAESVRAVLKELDG